MYTCCSALFEVSRSTPDLTRCIRQVDATPSDVSLLCKGGVGMRPGQRFGLSAIEKRDVWSRWKAGQSLHGSCSGVPSGWCTSACTWPPRSGIPNSVRATRRAKVAPGSKLFWVLPGVVEDGMSRRKDRESVEPLGGRLGAVCTAKASRISR